MECDAIQETQNDLPPTTGPSRYAILASTSDPTLWATVVQTLTRRYNRPSRMGQKLYNADHSAASEWIAAFLLAHDLTISRSHDLTISRSSYCGVAGRLNPCHSAP